jgi:hypothetical protein
LTNGFLDGTLRFSHKSLAGKPFLLSDYERNAAYRPNPPKPPHFSAISGVQLAGCRKGVSPKYLENNLDGSTVMATETTETMADDLKQLMRLAKFVEEQRARQASSRAAMEAARKEIRNQGRFVPKVDPPQPIHISF